MPLMHPKNSDFAVFVAARSLQVPPTYDDPDETANAQLAARLPYVFAGCRFAHYLKCIVRDKIGSFKERDDMERYLNSWINVYVDSAPNLREDAKVRRPLSSAEILVEEVEEVEGSPGYYDATFYLQPHYQLEGLTRPMRLTTKLPSMKG